MSYLGSMAAAFLMATGCGTATVDLPLDSDRDGLLTHEEEANGTNPNRKDTDGDSYLDGEEVDSRTDPRDPADHPYRRGWPLDHCRKSIESTGNHVGGIAHNFQLVDQDGGTVNLHDFCNHTVLLVSAAFW